MKAFKKSQFNFKLSFSAIFLLVFIVFGLLIFSVLKNAMTSTSIIPITGLAAMSENSCFRIDNGYEEITDEAICCKAAAESEGCTVYHETGEKNQYLCSFIEKRFILSSDLMEKCLKEGYQIKLS